jgi:hypothetical protein
MSHISPTASIAKSSTHGYGVYSRPASADESSDEDLRPVNGLRPGDPNSSISEIGFLLGSLALVALFILFWTHVLMKSPLSKFDDGEANGDITEATSGGGLRR